MARSTLGMDAELAAATELRDAQAYIAELEARIERLRAVAREAKGLPRQVTEWLWLEERWELGLALEALQPSDLEEPDGAQTES